MADEGRFGVIHVPDFVPGMSSYLRIGATVDDDYRWRDSTDGNRISTTTGDKVEVIEGDYKLIILGRQEHQSGVSAEKGKAAQSGITYRGTVKKDGDRLIEETEKGDVLSTFLGDVVDEYYGSAVTSQTGSESPGVDKENPHVIEKTWATRIESYTGSAALRVPLISQETWAVDMVSKTDVLSTTTETTVEGESRSSTKAGTITSSTEAEATTDVTTVTGTIESVTSMGKTISTTYGDSDDTTYGDTSSYHEGNSMVTVMGIETTVNIGMVNESVIGMMNDATIGATAEVTVGGTLNVQVGLEASVTLGAEVNLTLAEVTLEPAKIKMQLDKLRTALFRKNVAAFTLLA
ncbi:hypothetical protein [Chondromyces apiculatus]|uniref:Putative cell-wall-anchored protein SasA (LPXTG motif) n=1 Tax=Chondromyces apiculatus DSM 436 TaxID=1192034 RepID=A0A017T1L2_9BACT|nr:hypothetical protein [Chondromyces apiculatus]EYF03139.1 putative cell-wall-anchored protein SasA (LPXTG motif) [Chondromyces apiculatus DSM 436]